MKVKLSIKNRLKLCFIFLTNSDLKTGLIEQCPNCKSIDISNKQWNETVYEKGSEYHAVYTCNKCGAEATCMEDWYYNLK